MARFERGFGGGVMTHLSKVGMGQWLRLTKGALTLAILVLSYLAAYLTRFELVLPDEIYQQVWSQIGPVVALQFIVIVALGGVRCSWRASGLWEAKRLGMGIAGVAGLLLSFRLLEIGNVRLKLLDDYHISLSVVLLDTVFSYLGLLCLWSLRRLASRVGLKEPSEASCHLPARCLLIGAGELGARAVVMVRQNSSLGIQIVGFLDDDSRKVGCLVSGVRVLGQPCDISRVLERYMVDQVLVTMANVSGFRLRQIVRESEACNLRIRIIPGMADMMSGKGIRGGIRDLKIEDLLKREPVYLDTEELEGLVAGKVIWVSGAGGSIGSELGRQILARRPRMLVLVERGENALYAIEHELLQYAKGLELPLDTVRACLVDICNEKRLRMLFSEAPPHAIFHAAAHKHVPMMEQHTHAAFCNNFLGTAILAELAGEFRVGRFVLISTDKAVNPSSIMGATKRAAELYLGEISEVYRETVYLAVRFGNVLGSSGSVVPLFQKQIEQGGPITITHPEMSRYFMTIPEAAQLVLQAAVLSCDYSVFILKMGEAVRIIDLAEDLVRLSGYVLGEEIDIEYTGIRPGEKMNEVLCGEGEGVVATKHPGIMEIVGAKGRGQRRLRFRVEKLRQCVEDMSEEGVWSELIDIVPECSLFTATGKPDFERMAI